MARSPCLRLFREDISLPRGVTGPRDFAPLAREQRSCASVRGFFMQLPRILWRLEDAVDGARKAKLLKTVKRKKLEVMGLLKLDVKT